MVRKIAFEGRRGNAMFEGMKTIDYWDLDDNEDYPFEETYFYQGKPFTGIVTEHHENGNLKMEVELLDGFDAGYRRHWNRNGHLIYESYYSSGTPETSTREWFGSDSLWQFSILSFGYTLGSWEWDRTGALVKDFNEVRPLEEDSWTQFRTQRDASLAPQLLQDHQIMRGTAREGHLDHLQATLQSNKGQPAHELTGTFALEHADGSKTILQVREGQLSGWFLHYDASGALIEETWFQPGEPRNFSRTWHPDGTRATEQHGDFDCLIWERAWDANGVQLFSRANLPGTEIWTENEQKWEAYRERTGVWKAAERGE
jgi:antitoxin component YwqK of YwqJK toxin-antitoxin module